MPYSTQVSGNTITASWANANVRDQVVTPFASTSARDSAITVPVAGMVEYITSNDTAEGLTSRTSAGTWRAPWNLPWGVIGVASVTANQTGIGTSLADLTSMSITATFVANRRYLVHAITQLQQQTATGSPELALLLAGTQVAQSKWDGIADTITVQPVIVHSFTTTAGSKTIKLQAKTSTNTVNMNASSVNPCELIVTDIGPSGAPS